MAEIPDGDGGGSSGGGSTTSICTINPSDNISIVNNLISRISDIERFLSQLVGADVHADNLSELADNIGNILNGTITLPGDGNSPYGEGGSIPVPDDFTGTVISGNVLVVWENGVVSFEVDNSGIVVGSGRTKYCEVAILGSNDTISLVSSVYDPDNLVSCSGDTITITTPGVYQFGCINVINANHTAAAYGFLEVNDLSFSLPGSASVVRTGTIIGATSGTKYASIGSSFTARVPSSNFVLTAVCSRTAGTWGHSAKLSITKLSS